MTKSLKLRFVISISIVMIMIIASVAVVLNRATRDVFNKVLWVEEENEAILSENYIAANLTAFFDKKGSWEGVSRLDWSEVFGAHKVVLINKRREIILQYSRNGTFNVELSRKGVLKIDHLELPITLKSPSLILTDQNQERIGDLYIIPELNAYANTNMAKNNFFSQIDQWLIIIVVTGGAFCVIVTFFLVKNLLRPISILTDQTRSIAAGNFGDRLDFHREDELGELAQAFDFLAYTLEAYQTRQLQMTSDISHELRTPLTNIQGQIEAVRDGLMRPNKALINSLLEEVGHLKSIINDLQQLALGDSGELVVVPDYFDLNETLVKAVSAFGLRASRKFLEITYQPREMIVYADAIRVNQLITNLLENALYHAYPNTTIRIGTAIQHKNVQISLNNHGAIISENHASSIFNRFYKADPSRHDRTRGGGLGLSIAKQLVEHMNGEVWFTSNVSLGTTFYFTLPIENNLKQSKFSVST